MSMPEGTNPMVNVFFLTSIFIVMYFFMIRPQSQRAKKQRNFINDIEKGDKVVMNSGIHGKIVNIDEGTILLEVDANARIRFDKAAISMESTNVLKASDNKDTKKLETK